jgi:hypothetical protein
MRCISRRLRARVPLPFPSSAKHEIPYTHLGLIRRVPPPDEPCLIRCQQTRKVDGGPVAEAGASSNGSVVTEVVVRVHRWRRRRGYEGSVLMGVDGGFGRMPGEREGKRKEGREEGRRNGRRALG